MYIGFSYPKKFKIGAWLISKWIGKPYSHVYIRFDSPKIGSTIYHAANGMVHFRSETNFLKDNIVVKEYKLEVIPEKRHDILLHCMNLSGEPYGYSELLKIVFMDICAFLGCMLIKTYNGKGYICSELIGDVFDYNWKKPKHLLKPNDIEEALNGQT